MQGESAGEGHEGNGRRLRRLAACPIQANSGLESSSTKPNGLKHVFAFYCSYNMLIYMSAERNVRHRLLQPEAAQLSVLCYHSFIPLRVLKWLAINHLSTNTPRV